MSYDSPSKCITPPLIFSKVIKTLNTVVFPDPDGPMIDTISFFLISKFNLSKTIRSPYCLLRFRILQ